MKGAEMKPRALPALILVLLATSMAAEGATWIYVQADILTGNQYYIDTDRIVRPSKDVVRVWIKYVYSEKARDRMRKAKFVHSDASESRSLWEYNCATRESRVRTATWFNSQGEVIDTDTNNALMWNPIGPGTISEELYKAVCPKKGKE
jgi:Surface-adhesin protein E